ncbi:MAG: hypothetical protein Q8S03_10035 [Brevundimonas sp.]|uniref:hypothetical protein n=1 Tax=Brevundimonas sp. TaxID=1871086 RepID=UPI002734AC9F|nr:hypothetical protein [Brevundimonas sp.]MBX9615741.1 hypothetical protein [Caulobacteraceae bacterium]MDP3405018.1 hypothetical protein [Brevundimonas sp.]
MRNLFLTVAAVAALALPAAAQTDSVSFSIENNSSATIDSILYGQSSSDEWSDNILDYQVEPGDSVEITIDDGLEDCMYDFYYTFDDGSDYVERVDMCEIDGTTHEFTGG